MTASNAASRGRLELTVAASAPGSGRHCDSAAMIRRTPYLGDLSCSGETVEARFTPVRRSPVTPGSRAHCTRALDRTASLFSTPRCVAMRAGALGASAGCRPTGQQRSRRRRRRAGRVRSNCVAAPRVSAPCTAAPVPQTIQARRGLQVLRDHHAASSAVSARPAPSPRRAETSRSTALCHLTRRGRWQLPRLRPWRLSAARRRSSARGRGCDPTGAGSRRVLTTAALR